jgi:hypothetical protein
MDTAVGTGSERYVEAVVDDQGHALRCKKRLQAAGQGLESTAGVSSSCS